MGPQIESSFSQPALPFHFAYSPFYLLLFFAHTLPTSSTFPFCSTSLPPLLSFARTFSTFSTFSFRISPSVFPSYTITDRAVIAFAISVKNQSLFGTFAAFFSAAQHTAAVVVAMVNLNGLVFRLLSSSSLLFLLLLPLLLL